MLITNVCNPEVLTKFLKLVDDKENNFPNYDIQDIYILSCGYIPSRIDTILGRKIHLLGIDSRPLFLRQDLPLTENAVFLLEQHNYTAYTLLTLAGHVLPVHLVETYNVGTSRDKKYYITARNINDCGGSKESFILLSSVLKRFRKGLEFYSDEDFKNQYNEILDCVNKVKELFSYVNTRASGLLKEIVDDLL